MSQPEIDHFVMVITSVCPISTHIPIERRCDDPQMAIGPEFRTGSRVGNHRLLIQGNKMSNLTYFIVLAGLLLFPGPAPAAETEPIAALCARPSLLREAQEEMTVRDTAAATGIKESTLRQLLKGLAKEGRMCGG
jgi:hypothetical protein